MQFHLKQKTNGIKINGNNNYKYQCIWFTSLIPLTFFVYNKKVRLL